MFTPRLIPTLLLKNDLLYKTVQFANAKYIGDPLNTVRLFNKMYADELIILDIDATKNNTPINYYLLAMLSTESNMPLVYGGGINTIDKIRKILRCGFEKVIIKTEAYKNENFIAEAAKVFGSSTICVCIDVIKENNEYKMVDNKLVPNNFVTPVTFAKKMENIGAGEILIQSVSNDGLMCGYDEEITIQISEAVTLPVVALGGANNLEDVKNIHTKAMLNGVAAGSMFVYFDNKKGVLVNYPSVQEKKYVLVK
jgi:imidazole glycerol-phosphate synthase subunit HisF